MQFCYDQKIETKTKETTQHKEHLKFFTKVESKLNRRESKGWLFFFSDGTELSPVSKI